MTAGLRGLPPDNADLRLNADDLPHIVWLASLTGSVYYTNRAATEYTGHPLGTTHGWNLKTLAHPDDVAAALVQWERALSWQLAFDLEYRIRRHDGEYRWHTFRARPIRDSYGTVIKWVGTATDIEDAKQVERDARRSARQAAESLALLRILQANAPIGLGFVDCDFRRVLVNETLAAFNGSTVAEQIDRLVPDLVPDLWPQLEPLYRRVLQTGQPVLDVDVHDASGTDPLTSRYWRVSYYPVTISEEVIGIGIIALDVTDRKKAALADRTLASIVDTSFDAIFGMNPTGVITGCNAAATRLFGYRRDELIGLSFSVLVSEPQRLESDDVQARVVSGGAAERHETSAQVKDAGLIDVVVVTAPLLDETGTLIGLSAIVQEHR